MDPTRADRFTTRATSWIWLGPALGFFKSGTKPLVIITCPTRLISIVFRNQSRSMPPRLRSGPGVVAPSPKMPATLTSRSKRSVCPAIAAAALSTDRWSSKSTCTTLNRFG